MPLPKATDDESEITPVIQEKLSSTNLWSKKLTIFTALPENWAVPKIQEQFGVKKARYEKRVCYRPKNVALERIRQLVSWIP